MGFRLRLMKKIIITVLVIGIAGIGYWLISPLWRTEKVSEALPINSDAETKIEAKIIKSGSFSGFDKLHNGSGTANVLELGNKKYIRFEEDFMVTNGPDLYVALGRDGKYIKGSELERLKGNVGSQNYELPKNININDLSEIWIWCKTFSVSFAKAVLN